jgi:plastocyanin
VEFAKKEVSEPNPTESKFGYEPAKPPFGIRPGYASRAVTALEQDEESLTPTQGPSRAPASIVAKNAAPATSNPVSANEADFASATSRKGVQEVALIAGDLGFFPRVFFVSRDVPVRLYVTGASKNTLCLMMDSFQVKKQVKASKVEEITFTPSSPGNYRFYCPVNGMEGTLIVKDLTVRAE